MMPCTGWFNNCIQVCFFVSYLYMDSIISKWHDMGILQVRLPACCLPPVCVLAAQPSAGWLHGFLLTGCMDLSVGADAAQAGVH